MPSAIKRNSTILLFSVVLVAWFPIGFLAPKGFAPLYAALALGSLAILMVRNRTCLYMQSPVLWGTVAIGAFCAMSSLWSRTPYYSLETSLRLPLVLYGGVIISRVIGVLQPEEIRRIKQWIIIAGVIGFCWLSLEMATQSILYRWYLNVRGVSTDGPIGELYHLNNATTLLSLFFWPWLLVLYQKYGAWVTGLGFVVGGFVLMYSDADTIDLALPAGVFFFVAACVFKGIAMRAIAILLSMLVLMAPVVPSVLPDPFHPNAMTAALPNSMIHRLYIWGVTVKHIKQSPIIGHGYNTSRSFYGPEDKVEIKFPGRADSITAEPIPLHPHNAALQIWLELGAVGAALFAAVILVVFRSFENISPHVNRAAVAGYFCTVVGIAALSYGAWQSWWLCGVFMTSSIFSGLLRRSDDKIPS